MKAVNTAATRLPIWALTAISFVFVAYIGILGGVAILTERDVEFFPPKIGSGPKTKLVNEFSELRKDVKNIDTLLEVHIKDLYVHLNAARKAKAETKDFGRNVDLAVYISSLQRDIEKYEVEMQKEIDSLEELVKKTENRLLGI
ncbi:hypothetical protein J0676_22065 [Vibrio sp. Vb2880]|uniref:hypothetical protein n=1 Tax=Vibrio sp. Vb2880 TaxID=2816076 RepID=UPI001A909D78|nr:hypothetical protein [Vibrio sp. Vb2880]MBO0216186.1 hypothetical protein [Vibrio sp. Vb2880]